MTAREVLAFGIEVGHEPRCEDGPVTAEQAEAMFKAEDEAPQEPLTIVAQPYEARQCPECKLWVLVSRGPFAEGDSTKTLADANHWEAHHVPEGTDTSKVLGFPFFSFNAEPVVATWEQPTRAADVLIHLNITVNPQHGDPVAQAHAYLRAHGIPAEDVADVEAI